MPTNAEVISTLNGLIETCKDGEEGFQAAAAGVSDSTLREALLEFSAARSKFARQLQGVVSKMGGTPENTGSTQAAFRRGWINIKTVVLGKNEESVIDECLMAEDAAVEIYWAALETLPPDPALALVREQYNRICDSKDFVLDLKLKSRYPDA